ncbi:MAG TPA: threonine ammonia-lyase, biosynthetic [Candidatus Saccharimonadales bacterium]|nr:threonine ammonia-lyase, biosynthetic [Candidatus Saccharimonadales bacterium]
METSVRETLLAKVYDIAIESPLDFAKKSSRILENNIYLKREDLQPVNSFKLRGAYNKIASLTAEEKKRGVIAVSAGNHAQGVALSAQKLNLLATIVMPKTTPDIKVEAVKSFGAEVILFGDNYDEAYEHCRKLMDKTGRILVHPFNDPYVIAGQGTIGREIMEQLPDTDYIFVPVGGGGLIAGIAQYVKSLNPDVQIIGVEPADCNAMQMSLRKGRIVELNEIGIFADGVAVKKVGDLTFDIVRNYVDDIITVTTDQICAAIKTVFEETRSIVEPAGALSIAGAYKHTEKNDIKGKNIVVINSGANMSFEKLQFVSERTLVGSSKEALFSVELPEKAGALRRFCSEIIQNHNITEFNYRLDTRARANIFVGVSLSGVEDKKKFINLMKRKKYNHIDMSNDDIAKDHIRHMIGGKSTVVKNEKIYEVIFPERPNALSDFLENLAGTSNISLFHYRGVGADVGKVLVGFETEETGKLENVFKKSGMDYTPIESIATKIYL